MLLIWGTNEGLKKREFKIRLWSKRVEEWIMGGRMLEKRRGIEMVQAI